MFKSDSKKDNNGIKTQKLVHMTDTPYSKSIWGTNQNLISYSLNICCDFYPFVFQRKKLHNDMNNMKASK